MAYMLALAGGGGGGGGFTRAAASAGGGGGGGACSGLARLIIPIFLLPDTLFVAVGLGGLGGAASGAGAAGTNSYVSLGRQTIVPSVILASGINAPGGGAAGTGAAAGTGGSVPSIATIDTMKCLGIWAATVGIVGAAGGVQTGAVGVSVTAWGVIPLSPGAGGAGCTTTDFAGGGQTATAAVEWAEGNFPTTAGYLSAGGATAGMPGGGGVELWKPFFKTGGAGGASNNSATAGAGGKGAVGCGGGGGGAGATGGRGGDGGNGMVVIISW